MDFGIKINIMDIPYYVDELLTTHRFKKEISKFLIDASQICADIYVKNNKSFIINSYFFDFLALDGTDLIKGICMQIPINFNTDCIQIFDLIVDSRDGSLMKGTEFEQYNYFSITDGFNEILNKILAKIQPDFITIFINNVIKSPKLECSCTKSTNRSEWFISINLIPLELNRNILRITKYKKSQTYSISTISLTFDEKATINTQEDLDTFVINFVTLLNENEENKELADALLDCLIC